MVRRWERFGNTSKCLVVDGNLMPHPGIRSSLPSALTNFHPIGCQLRRIFTRWQRDLVSCPPRQTIVRTFSHAIAGLQTRQLWIHEHMPEFLRFTSFRACFQQLRLNRCKTTCIKTGCCERMILKCRRQDTSIEDAFSLSYQASSSYLHLLRRQWPALPSKDEITSGLS